jgi:hypothetical protein
MMDVDQMFFLRDCRVGKGGVRGAMPLLSLESISII